MKNNGKRQIRYKNILAYGEDKLYQLFHGRSIVPDVVENRSVRYFSTSIPLACAVEIIEYKSALHFAPRSVLLNSQFLRPTVKGLIAFSALLLSIGTSPSSMNVYRYFFSLRVYLTASTSLFLPLS